MKNLLLFSALLFCGLSFAQLGVIPCSGPNGSPANSSALQPGDYQNETLAAAGKFNAIKITTYTNEGTEYTPNRYTYSNDEWYYLSFADTAGVPTHAPATVSYPLFLWLCQPGTNTLINYSTTRALPLDTPGGIHPYALLRFDSTYTFTNPSAGFNADSTQVDSVRLHLYLKYNFNSRTILVNADDAINDGNVSGPQQYLHKAKIPTVPQTPVGN